MLCVVNHVAVHITFICPSSISVTLEFTNVTNIFHGFSDLPFHISEHWPLKCITPRALKCAPEMCS